jgi:glucosamine--fructose-6-phosphate aminotransferase (isomerizing)
MSERNFAHAMLREIYEQPAALAHTLEQYVAFTPASKERSPGTPVNSRIQMESLTDAAECFRRHKDLVIAASGSSRHAGLAAEIMLEDAAGLAVDVEYASEYITRSTNTKRDPAVLVISQSGETADTLAALREAKQRKHPTLAVTNVENSSMADEADIYLPTHAGVERAIPATKSFTAQLLVLRLLSLEAADARGTMDAKEMERQLAELWEIPPMIERQLDGWREATERLAAKYSSAKTLLYLGRGIHYAIAREGALKLKESSYMHAEGYPAGELKHGPNALVSDEVPIVALGTVDWQDAESVLRYEKTVALLTDLKAQGARTIVLTNAGDEKLRAVASDVVEIEAANEYLLPITEVVPLQMFAYYMALENGVDVDRPRNLVKAVVQE